MKDVQEVLKLKEAEMIRVRCELECLRLVAPLLHEEGVDPTVYRHDDSAAEALAAAEKTRPNYQFP